MAVQQSDNPVFNAISTGMDNEVEGLRDTLEKLQSLYWEQNNAVSEYPFSSRSAQLDAIERLSKLGLALKSVSEAISAVNAGRCW